jgi:PAS domain S-box-containing protein
MVQRTPSGTEATRRLFELSNDAALVEVDGRIVAANEAAVALYAGVAPSDLIGRSSVDLVTEDLRDHLRSRVGRVLAGVEQERWAEERILRLDGAVHTVVARTSPVTWEGRAAVLILLREQHRGEWAASALAERDEIAELVARASYEIGVAPDERLDAAIEGVLALLGAHDGADRAYVILFDTEGRRIFNTHEWVAEGIEAQIGYVQDLRTADFPWSFGVLARGQAVHLPDLAAPPPGAEAEAASFGRFGVRSALQVPMMAGGVLVGLVGFNHVRSSKTWRQETIVLLRDVGALIATAMIRRRAAEEAARARDAAMAANRAKDEFLSRMSHELRTPLNAILGFGELLAADLDGHEPEGAAEHGEHVERIVHAGRHLLALVEDVLDIARIEADRLPLRIEPVDARALCGRAMDLVAEAASAARVRVVLEPGPEVVILADETRALQVLLNVLTNAVKYNRAGGGVRMALTPGPRTWEIRVADDGPGIRPDRLGRVFEPFDRLGAEFTNVEGTGIGLTLARRLMTLLGGDISISSRVGEGTEVRLAFPAAASTAPTRAFLIDEDPMVRGMAAAVLSVSGLEVRSVDGPAQLAEVEDLDGGVGTIVLVGAADPADVAALRNAALVVAPAARVVCMCGRTVPGSDATVARPPDPVGLRALLGP